MGRIKKSTLRFAIVYIILSAAFIGFWIFLINGVVKKDMDIFEAAQPNHKMDEFVKVIESGDISSMDFAEGSSRFESPDIFKNTFAEAISGKKITYKANETSYDALAPVYELYAGEGDSELHIATVQLQAVNVEPLMKILTKQDWEVASVTPIYEAGSGKELSVVIPDTYTAYVNGIQLEASEYDGEPTDYKEFEIVAQYVDVPKQMKYKVSGLLMEPSVEIRDASGTPVAYEQNGSVYSVGFTGGDVPEDISETALKNAKDISAIYAGDRTLKSMRDVFPEDSYLIPLFQNYIDHDLWMYSGHAEPVYSDEATSDYIRYNDSFYSVVVYFNKTMYLPKRDMTVTVTTHNTYYYIYQNEKWIIADMVSINDEE
ncbi:MAG: hypothetical protein J5570_08115 [Lachnospiraceae bacterium]|nr:hypothetical protein [Lachnospiraceae bacterium]